MGHGRTDGGAGDAEPGTGQCQHAPRCLYGMCRVYHKEVEYNIKGAHHHRYHTGNKHITAAAQHRPGHKGKVYYRHRGSEDGKVGSTHVAYDALAAKPVRQPGSNSHGKQGHQYTDSGNNDRALTHHTASLGVFAAAQKMGHLHGEAHNRGRTQAPKEPCRSCNKSYRSGRLGTEVTHHSSIDILHKQRGQLGHNGRPTKPRHHGKFAAQCRHSRRPQLGREV